MATLTLENGTNVSSLSKANLELEILKLQPDATFHMPTRKHDLLVLLNTLIKSELGQRGTFGMLPDWRPIHLMPVATLRAEISTRHGSAVGIKRVLCLELERLNREALGLSPRTPSPGIEQSPLSPHATAFSPLAPPGILAAGTSSLGLEIPPASPNNAQQGGVSVFSPQAEPPAQLPLGSPLGLPTPPAALLTGVAGTTFTALPESLQAGVPDVVIVVAAGAALRIASENLSDDPLSLYGNGHIKLSHLFILFSHLALDHTAGQLPVGSTLTLPAFSKLHDAIAASLLEAPRASTFSELSNRCRQLLSQCSMVLSAADFTTPDEPPSIGGPVDYFAGFSLNEFGPHGLYRYAVLYTLCGGMLLEIQRDPTTNPNLKVLLDDLLTPIKDGGLLPNVGVRCLPMDKRKMAFSNFLVFRHLRDYSLPFDMGAYFQLRQLDDGIRSGNADAIDSTVPSQITNPSSYLHNLARLLCDTPFSEMASVLYALKSVLQPSLVASPNSAPTLALLNSTLADYDCALPPPSEDDCFRISIAPAMDRVKAIQGMKDSGRLLSASSAGLSGSSNSSDGNSAKSYAAAGHMAAPFLKVMDSLPCDEKGQESLLETALQAKLAFFVRAMVNKPSQAQIHAFKALGKLHSIAQTHLTSYIAKMVLVGFGQFDYPGLHLQLTASLDLSTLLSMLEGNFPDTTKLLEMYGQFCSIVRDGARVKFTAQSISVDLNEFEQFIAFLEVLLTALCFNATALPKLVEEAKNLAFISSKAGGSNILEKTLVPSLDETLKGFGVSIRAWMHAMDGTPPLPLTIKNGVVQEATEGVKQFNKMNFFRFGLQPLGAPSRSESSSTSLSTSSSERSGTTRPPPVRATSSSNKKPRMKGAFSIVQGSGANPPGLVKIKCASGFVVKWGGFFDATKATTALKETNPSMTVRDSYFPCMFAKQNTPERFMSYIPVGTSEADIAALRAWYDAARGKAFEIARPADFR